MAFLIAVIFATLGVSFLCSLLEAAYLSISHLDIAEISSKKPRLGKKLNDFKDNIQKPIAVILIINTLAHTMGASLSGAQFDELFGPKWIVLFSIIFSLAMIQWTEILPKALGVRFNVRVAKIFTLPLVLLIKIFTPLIRLIEWTNKPFIENKEKSDHLNTVNEITVLSRFAVLNNLITNDQEQIIERTVNLTQKKTKDIMVPKSEIKYLKTQMDMPEALIEAHIHNHTRYPLIDETDPYEILGYINFKDIVSALKINTAVPSLKGITRPIMIVNEEEPFSSLFKKLTINQQHIAIVKNKNKHIVGLVTLEDVIEEIIGDIEDEYDYDFLPDSFYPITNNRYIAGGNVLMGKINDTFSETLEDAELTINDWVKKNFGKEQKSGNKHTYNNTTIIVKKVFKSKICEVIIEQKTKQNIDV
jgi:CBS domain containing-hemolysin-like protein